MKDGALDADDEQERQPYVVPRRRLALAAWLTLLALPILVIDNIPRTDAKADQARVAVAPEAGTETTAVVIALPPPTAPATTEAAAIAAPESTAAATTPPTTAKPKVAATTTTTVKPKPKPTTTTTTTTAPPAAPVNSQQGGASWYDYRAGECAHPSLPKGTLVHITNLANGASTSCIVTDRGPYEGGRIIDLDRATFAQIASTSQGLISVRITW